MLFCLSTCIECSDHRNSYVCIGDVSQLVFIAKGVAQHPLVMGHHTVNWGSFRDAFGCICVAILATRDGAWFGWWWRFNCVFGSMARLAVQRDAITSLASARWFYCWFFEWPSKYRWFSCSCIYDVFKYVYDSHACWPNFVLLFY